jgi:hypothetical protein
MITIFCVFRQFSAKKMEFFSKTNVMIIFFLQNYALFRVKNANFFVKFLGENIFKKSITSVPAQKKNVSTSLRIEKVLLGLKGNLASCCWTWKEFELFKKIVNVARQQEIPKYRLRKKMWIDVFRLDRQFIPCSILYYM